uniref:Diacylglycerol kinase n=1 Tax=Desulfovibrio desulfuricans (strain ATCC 27774 / DSM 6949 / MB) TaxID=525146 RepID=B8IYV1_DESDA
MLKKICDVLYRRCVGATRYSVAGFRAALTKEEAFRLELAGLAVLVLVLLVVPWPLWKKFLLTGSYLLILIVELLNSAIEDVCDLFSSEYSELIKNAKDKGSMAVLTALLCNVLLLIALILL